MEKKFNWDKKGLIVAPEKNLWWMKSHAMCPAIQDLGNGMLKIFFSGRDSKNISHIGAVDVDLNNFEVPVAYPKEPLLSPGQRGCFDDNGVTPSCVISNKQETLLYYIGWNPGHNVRMHLFGGLAISNDGGKTFKRYSRAPILERNRVNPFLNTAPFVIRVKKEWIMYYVAGTEWVHKDLPRYNIQIANSTDWKNWVRKGIIAIDYLNEKEMALAKPCVIFDQGIFRMWFSFKEDVEAGGAYQIGYAESQNGVNWTRLETGGLVKSDSGWDSDMVEYGTVIKYNEKYYMFYNGNNYGANGIGLAISN